LIEKSRAFGRDLLRGITRYCGVHGSWLFLERPEFYQSMTRSLIPWIKDIGADGIIGHIADEKIADLAADMGIPAVFCGSRTPVSTICSIITDNDVIGKIAAEYFRGRGFRLFAFCGFAEMHWSRERCAAFEKCLAQIGYEVSVYEQRKTARNKDSELQAIAEWLKPLPKPIALMACNDDRGREVLQACSLAGIRVPDDVAVLGVDNDDLICTICLPELSSIALNTEKAGYEAAQLIDRLMAGEAIDNAQGTIIIVPQHVITRQSTDVLAVHDRCVAAAVRFIREHRRELIQVSDVAKAAGVSRRLLQQRFSSELGHSVYEEIRRTNIDLMARMLVETDLPVSQIANFMGYSYVRNISRWFHKTKKITPSAYRKLHRTTSAPLSMAKHQSIPYYLRQ